MKEIRIEKVYGGTGYQTFVNLKQISKGVVQYQEDVYLSRYSAAVHCEPKLITTEEANRIFRELRKTADPYIRYSENTFFYPMKERKTARRGGRR